jgi:GTP-sensing pleiotropic transcriptional regulator CodY
MKSTSSHIVTDGNLGKKVQSQKSFRIIQKKKDEIQNISAFSENGGQTFDVRKVRQYINKDGKHHINAGIYKLTKDQVLNMLQKKNKEKELSPRKKEVKKVSSSAPSKKSQKAPKKEIKASAKPAAKPAAKPLKKPVKKPVKKLIKKITKSSSK